MPWFVDFAKPHKIHPMLNFWSDLFPKAEYALSIFHKTYRNNASWPDANQTKNIKNTS